MKRIAGLCTVLLVAAPSPLAAGNSLVTAALQKGIAKSTLSAMPAGEWNRLGRRDGKFVELWTRDGDSLNKVTFFGGVPVGEPLFKEADKKNQPLPRVSAGMLITDIPVLLESSYRIQLGVNSFTVTGLEPSRFSTHPGVTFTYTFVGSDEVERKGEGVGALVKGRLYITTYEAPAIYFFDKDLAAFRQLAATLKI